MVEALRYLSLVMILFSVGFLLGWTTEEWRRRTFPWCVWGLVLSYILYAAGAAIEIQLRLGTPLTWRTPLVVGAAAVGFAVQVWAYFTHPFSQRRRRR